MTLSCTPFLLFDGHCAEAMGFYHECLGGEANDYGSSVTLR